MGTDVIKVYARLKPEKDRDHVANYRIHRRPKDHTEEDFLVLQAPSKLEEYIDHRPESWNFSFHRIIEEEANQRDVFEDVGRPVIESVLDGYNGTVFAYGQTGSGKTYSITGEGTMNDRRGIIPRTLRYLFDVIKMHPENVYSVEVAYLEIYNEYGYDLLDRKQVYQQQQQAMRLEDLPRVSIQEDEKGRLHLKNLTFHNVKNEDQAMELFLLGDSRRITADTPMNPQSSRSHCIFTIVVSIKQLGANRYKKAKMHLVDLAGSERVYKCAINGTILNEAKYINLSLHYLEQVIVCLGQETPGHIPYRNCLLTAILRDSLGGNCVTTMLATLSISSANLPETISTCRFAQRVALVRNDAKLIMEHDLDSENTLLKLENEKLRKQVEELMKQNESLKDMLPLKENGEDSVKKLEYYKNLVEQRDKEISVLINLLKKAKNNATKRNAEVNEEEDKTSVQDENISLESKSDSVKSDKSEIKSKVKIKTKESIAERLLKMGKLQKATPKIELTLSDSKNDVQIEKEGKNESNIQLGGEFNKSESMQYLKKNKIDKITAANLAKSDTIKLEEKFVMKDVKAKSMQDLIKDRIDQISEANLPKSDAIKLEEKLVMKNNKSKNIQDLTKDRIDQISEANLPKSDAIKLEEKLVMKNNKSKNIQDLMKDKIDQISEANLPKSDTIKLEEKLVSKDNDRNWFNDKIPSPDLHTHKIMTNQFPDLVMNDVLIKNSVVNNNHLEKQDLITDVEYDKGDHDFDQKLPLTGDPEIDEEIVAFYKAKRTGGIY